MKKILVILMLFRGCTPAFGQYIGVEAGITRRVPVVSLLVGAQVGDFVCEADMRSVMRTDQPAYFGGQVGYSFKIHAVSLIPLVGEFYRFMSSDGNFKVNGKFENRFLCGAGLRALFRSGLFVEASYSESSLLLIGFKGHL